MKSLYPFHIEDDTIRILMGQRPLVHTQLSASINGDYDNFNVIDICGFDSDGDEIFETAVWKREKGRIVWQSFEFVDVNNNNVIQNWPMHSSDPSNRVYHSQHYIGQDTYPDMAFRVSHMVLMEYLGMDSGW